MNKPKRFWSLALLAITAGIALGIMPMTAFAATSGNADLAIGTGAFAPSAESDDAALSAQNYENNTYKDAKVLGWNTEVTGASVKAKDEDWYQMVVEKEGVVTIVFKHECDEEDPGQWDFSLCSEDLYELNDWIVRAADTNVFTTCSIGLPAGNYYIRVRSGDENTWTDIDYTITAKWTASAFWEHEPLDNDSSRANPMMLGENYKGSMLKTSDVDWFKFTMPKEAAFELQFSHPVVTEPENSTWGITLYDQNFSEMENVTSRGEDKETKIDKKLQQGTYYIRVVSGGTEYTSSKTYALRVVLVGNLKKSVIAPISTQTYTGKALKPALDVTFMGAKLKAGVDYQAIYKKNVNVGTDTATVTIKGIGAFKNKGTNSATFSIGPEDISKTSASTIAAKVFNGKPQKPKPKLELNGKKLVYGTDYTVTWKKNVNPGTARAVVKGKDNFTGKKTVKFKINTASIEADNVIVGKIAPQDYTGEAVKPKPKLSLTNGYVLKKGVDYKLSYKDNVKKGTATVIIKGKGSFTGERTVNFKIGRTSISKATVQTIEDQPYAKKAIKPLPVVTYNDKTLKKGVDYKLSYKNNFERGIATVIIKGKGNYGKTKRVTFEIVKGSVKNATTSRMPQQDYTGQPIKPTPKVYLNGVVLKKGVDYKLSYKNNVKKGTATITIKGIGNFTGKAEATFKIV